MTGAAAFGPPAREALDLLLAAAPLQRLFKAIDRDGDETRIVGGAVRDALLGRRASEVDLATTARPETVVERAEAAGLRAVPTGMAHGTITVVVDGAAFELTSLREDVETDGRHAWVRFGRDFAADARRRDFTINALFLDSSGRLFDFVGGLDDLAAGKVRFIGEPAQRIREDYLRILRFYRFSAEFSAGAFDAAGARAALAGRAGLSRLSRERVRAELLKLLAARRAADAAQALSEAGLLGPLVASAPDPARLRKLAALDPGPADPLLRLAALCIAVVEDAQRIGERLRLSNAEQRRLALAAAALPALHGAAAPPPEQALRQMLFLHGREAASDALRLAASSAPQPAGWTAALAFVTAAPEPRLPFSGDDLIARGLASGPAVGAALDLLRRRWMSAGFPDDAEALSRLLAETAPDPPR